MSLRQGRYCKVTLGTETIVGMGTWSLNGINADQMDTTSFGDNWKTFEFGQKDGGTISFSGFADPDDETGQMKLQEYNLENTDVTSIRLYVDNTSYYTPCQTTGYFSPFVTQNASTKKSLVNVNSFNVNVAQNGMMQIDFTCKVSGVMVLV